MPNAEVKFPVYDVSPKFLLSYLSQWEVKLLLWCLEDAPFYASSN